MKAVKPGWFAQVGDLVREGWCMKKRCIAPPYTYGIVVKTKDRSACRVGAYTPEQIAAKPVHTLWILTTKGERIRRYTVHVEVINEGG